MPKTGAPAPLNDGSGDDHRSPHDLFARIRATFHDLGVLGEQLSVEHKGVRYRVSCDDRSFMVYRVSENHRVRHHVPGWPVCLVNGDTIFEECGSPVIGDDHCACTMGIDHWVELVVGQCGDRTRSV